MILFWGFVLHLVGDYVIQTDKMANLKTQINSSGRKWAAIHAITYTLPFLLLTHSFLILFIIGFTHYMIDHYRLPKYFIYWKERLTGGLVRMGNEYEVIVDADGNGVKLLGKQGKRRRYTWLECSATGYDPTKPEWLAFWLLILVDNTFHIIINSLSLAYL